jgi:hypothetical protein
MQVSLLNLTKYLILRNNSDFDVTQRNGTLSFCVFAGTSEVGTLETPANRALSMCQNPAPPILINDASLAKDSYPEGPHEHQASAWNRLPYSGMSGDAAVLRSA